MDTFVPFLTHAASHRLYKSPTLAQAPCLTQSLYLPFACGGLSVINGFKELGISGSGVYRSLPHP